LLAVAQSGSIPHGNGVCAQRLGVAGAAGTDREGAQGHSRDPATFESTHRGLALANIADLAPPRFFYLAWFSHPAPSERIAAAHALR
jgi:STE24 endopeptidase